MTQPQDSSDSRTANGTDLAESGLSSAEVEDCIRRGKVNRRPATPLSDYTTIVARNTFTLFNALVVPAAIILFTLGDYRAAWAVSAIAVFNTLISLVQEIRAKWHLAHLALLGESKVRVRRNGETIRIAASEIVLGEYLLLEAGETVMADGVLLDAEALTIDEALLTGESDPIPRQVGERLLSGSVCVAGHGLYRADRVGGDSFAHQTAIQARQYRYLPSPFLKSLDQLIRILTALAIILCLCYWGLQQLRGFTDIELVQMIAATITSMVPQGLVLMTTLAYTLGALRMSRQGALVQRLSSVESMASVSMLCLDKTGTLTTNQLSLDLLQPLGISQPSDVRIALQVFAWGSMDHGNKTIEALRKQLGNHDSTNASVIERLPFQSRFRMSAVRVLIDNRERVFVLGAFDTLIGRCSPADRAETEAFWSEQRSSGLRLLLFAEATPLENLDSILHHSELIPLALLGFQDELRQDAGEVLKSFAEQGIEIKIISGDHADTVHATVRHLPLPGIDQPVTTGDTIVQGDLRDAVQKHSVFGRVSPQQKLEIITALQSLGHHVAMIGDGVNDLLSIKRADLGIAMGSGSASSKLVAGLVLISDEFAILPRILDEGRRILDNLRAAAKLFLLKNVYTLVLILLGVGVFGFEFPYLPQQVTLLNVLTIGGPTLLLLLRRNHSTTSGSHSFVRDVGLLAIVIGSFIGMISVGLLILTSNMGYDLESRRTLLLEYLIFAGLGNAVAFSEFHRSIVIWSAIAVLLFFGVLLIPPITFFFALSPSWDGSWVGIMISAVLTAWIGSVLNNRWHRIRM